MKTMIDIVTNGRGVIISSHKTQRDLYKEAFESAVEKLDVMDRNVIETYLKECENEKMSFNDVRIKNLGKVAKLELLGALGIWLTQFNDREIDDMLVERNNIKKELYGDLIW